MAYVLPQDVLGKFVVKNDLEDVSRVRSILRACGRLDGVSAELIEAISQYIWKNHSTSVSTGEFIVTQPAVDSAVEQFQRDLTILG